MVAEDSAGGLPLVALQSRNRARQQADVGFWRMPLRRASRMLFRTASVSETGVARTPRLRGTDYRACRSEKSRHVESTTYEEFSRRPCL
jgi:hypothetical protein